MKNLLKYLCPHTWFKKREIVFYKDFPHFDKLNIISESSTYKREWMKKSKIDFDEKLLNKKIKDRHITSAHRCLGINSLFEKGFLLKNPIDFAVETQSYIDEPKIHQHSGFLDFGFFSYELFGKYNSLKNCNKNLIKISNFCLVDSPKDIVFLVLPVFYSDDNRFMSCAGILDPVLSREVSIILYWFCENSYDIVRKGTPLAQLIPFPRNMVCDSWRMSDNIPINIHKTKYLQSHLSNATMCPFYSEYKKISNDIY